MFHSKMLSISALPYVEPQAHNQEVLVQAQKEAKALGLYIDQLYEGHHDMTVYLFPTGMTDRVIDATLVFTMLYFVDDLFGEDTREAQEVKLAQFKACWEGNLVIYPDQSPEEKNLYRAVHLLAARMREKTPPEFMARYTAYLDLHLAHSVAPKTYTTTQEYRETRLHFGGMYPTILMLEYCTDTYLPEDMSNNPTLLALLENVSHIGALSNDLISYPKEKHSAFNLINAYLRCGEAETEAQAIQKTILHLNELYKSYQQLIEELAALWPASSADLGEQYIEGVKHIMSAVYHWQIHTKRYKHPAHILEDLKQ